MKTSEKVLIGLVLLSFSLQAIFAEVSVGFAVLACLILAGTYAIGGHSILNNENKSEKFLSIAGGISLASSIIILPTLVSLPWNIAFKIIPLVNIFFCIGLGVYLIWKRRNKDNKTKKKIFIRSLVVLIITSFFAYSSPLSLVRSSTLCRGVIKTLNRHNSIYNNMNMIDYMVKVKESLKDGNCDLAIDYGHKAKKEGLIWLGIENFNLNDTSLIDDIRPMSNIFSSLYRAYKCKADNMYENQEFDEALILFQKTDSFLTFNEHKSWNLNKIRSAINIAEAFSKLKKYEQADSFYVEATNRHHNTGDTSKYGLMCLFQELSESFMLQEDYSSANDLLKEANVLTANLSNANQIKAKHYIYLTTNYLQLDSLGEAKINLDSVSNLIIEEHTSYGAYLMIKGRYSYQKNEYKKSSEYYLQALEKYKEKKMTSKSFVQLYHLLGRNMMALAKYKKATEYVEKGLSLVASENLQNSLHYPNLLVLQAELKFNRGKYDEAKELYSTILQSYLAIYDKNNTNFISIYTSLSEVELKLFNIKEAKNYADKATLIAEENELQTPATTFYRNNAAYVNYFSKNYRVADTLYNSTIRIHRDFNRNLSAELANAYNGLGLIALDKRQYKKADTLFLKSLEMNEVMFEGSHPNIATIQYNQASLRIRQGKDQEAEDLLNSAYKTFEEYYGENHDEIADVYLALGNIAKKRKDKKLAKEFYTKSHNIFRDIFGDNHAKTQIAKRLMK
jgi:tetratricopeptide (TPR) repeat protein